MVITRSKGLIGRSTAPSNALTTPARLAKGIEIDGVRYDGIETAIDRRQGGNVWLTMALREGKNREIRRVLSHLGLEVNRLIRVSYGAFQLGQLVPGAIEEVPPRAQIGRAHV